MSLETRIVRPFHLANDLRRCLDCLSLRFGAEVCMPGGRITVSDPHTYLRSVPRLCWGDDEAQFDAFKNGLAESLGQLGIRPQTASLVVTAYTPYLKMTDILIMLPVSQIDSLKRECVFHPERPRALQASTHGAVVTAYLVLNRNLSPKPLRPWRKGTWLAKVAFQLRTDTGDQVFRLTPLDAQRREELNLPKDCVHYLEMEPSEVVRPFEGSAVPVFYVDADLLAQLDRTKHSATGKALQVQLVRDLLAGVIMNVAASDGDQGAGLTWDEVRGSLLGRIVSMVAGTEASPEEGLRYVSEDPVRLIALIEGAVNLRQHVAKVLSDEE